MSTLKSIASLNITVAQIHAGENKQLSPIQWTQFNRAHNLYYPGNRLVSPLDYAIQHKIRYIGITKGVTRYYSN